MPSTPNAATPLPAVSLCEKGGVLEGSGICRILPTGGSGSAGKNQDWPIRPRFYTYATCGFVAENRVALGDFRFFPALPENTATPSVPKRKPLRIPPENNLLNAKTAYRRFPRTKPDAPSQGLITVGTLRKNPISVNPLPASRSELRLSSNASVKLHVSRKTPATTSFPNRDVSFDRPNLTSKQKEGRRINPLQVSPEGLHRNCPYSSR